MRGEWGREEIRKGRRTNPVWSKKQIKWPKMRPNEIQIQISSHFARSFHDRVRHRDGSSLSLSLLSSRVLRLKSSSTWSKHVAVCGPTGYFLAHFLMAGSGREIDGAWALTVRIPVSEQISKGIGKRTRESKRSGMGGIGAGVVSRKLIDGRRVEERA